jgi:hypothetical protein
MSKKVLSFLTVLLFFATGVFSQTIRIQNKTINPYKEKVVEIPWQTVISNFPKINLNNFKVINAATKKELIYQLEYKGKKEVQNLLIEVSVDARSSLNLILVPGKHQSFRNKTYCRFVPERKDDFAWENDKITFRAYGKALESTNENAYGLDVWVKRNDSLVINHRYKENDYHVDHGNGLDYYHVGFSLGAGNMAPYFKDSIRFAPNFYNYKVLDNGPLRSSFTLYFKDFMVGGKSISSTKTISLDAGSQLNKIQATYISTGDTSVNVVAGIVKREEPGVVYMNQKDGILGYWEPQHGDDGITGVATLINNVADEMLIGKENFLTVTKTKNHQITYYAGAVWNKAGRITSAQQWFKYLDEFQNQLKFPLSISVIK